MNGPTLPTKPIPPTVPGAKAKSDGADAQQNQQNTGVVEPKNKQNQDVGRPAGQTSQSNQGNVADTDKHVTDKKESAGSAETKQPTASTVDPGQTKTLPLADSSAQTKEGTTEKAVFSMKQQKQDYTDIFFFAFGLFVVAVTAFILWEKLRTKPALPKQEKEAKKEVGGKPTRVFVDYSTDSTRELTELIFSSAQYEVESGQPKVIHSGKRNAKEIKSNFEIRI